jgi:uncharacterized membrane protein YbhN (UPF0104 family)
MKIPKGVGVAVRVAGVAALLWLGLTSVDLDAVGRTFEQMSPAPALAGVATLLAGQLVGAQRWRAVVARLGGEESPRWFATEYLRGCFYSSMLPTGYGGDVARVAAAGRLVGTKKAAVSVGLDRAWGFASLAAAGLLLLPAAGYGVSPALAIAAAVGTGLALAAGAPLARRRRYGGVAGWSALYVLLWVGGVWLLAGSLGVGFPAAALPAVMAIVGVAMALPVTVGATGTREAGFAIALTPLGVGATDAVALGIAFGLAVALVGLCGAPAALRVMPAAGQPG